MVNETHQPYVPAEKSIPEITFLSILLGCTLSIILGAANVYLGLYAGMTVSASIPAAVMSMILLKAILKRGTILENNIVQTIASSGEALAAGVIFTIPALVITEAWHEFHFWPTTLITMTGGLLGVLFMIPLRQALVVEEPELKYPEGVACAEVLKTGDKGRTVGKAIFSAIVLGGLYKFVIQGLGLIKGGVEWAKGVGGSLFYFGTENSLALFSVGYIVGLNVAALVFIGGLIGWTIGLPIYAMVYGLPAGDSMDVAWTLWSTKIRYVGVGAMAVGGLYTLFNCRMGIKKGLKKIFAAKNTAGESDIRTDREMSRSAIITIGILTSIAVFFLYRHLTHNTAISLISTLIMLIASFFFVAVASYIVGLVGSSNSPVSGMTICALLFAAGVLLLFGFDGKLGVIALLGIAGVVCCATCSSGDICQDLKTGYIVGATPRNQQWAQIVGTIVPAFIFAPVLTLLHRAYTIGSPKLAAPQAMLFSKLAGAFFLKSGELPMDMVYTGGVVALTIIIADEILKRKKAAFRLHIMAVAVGIYLPLVLSVPIFLGGLVHQYIKEKGKKSADGEAPTHKGIMIASGLIAGEALMGIFMAGLIVLGEQYPAIKPPYSIFGLHQLPELATAGIFILILGLLMKWMLSKNEA